MRARARFIEPMQLLRSEMLPSDTSAWSYELKFDGYRALAFKSAGRVYLRSRNDKDFAVRYSAVVEGLAAMPDETVIDGEIVALDDEGRPSFSILQNYGSSAGAVQYYVFDLLILAGKDVTHEPLTVRRALLEAQVLGTLAEPVRYTAPIQASLRDLVHSVKVAGLEGLVAKRLNSRYESGLRTGAWLKMRVNRGQEFVIGGYTVGIRAFDALIFGYFEDGELLYAARTRSGFTPAVRAALARRFAGLVIDRCPFANLPEKKSGRWGQGLTAAKMKTCVWLQPQLVAQIEFLEWTGENHLRHSRFIALRDDKRPEDVHREP